MIDPNTFLKTIDSATKVGNSSFFTTIIDKLTGFTISKWNAESEIRKRAIIEEYEKALEQGITGMQFIESMRKTKNLIDVAVKSTEYINPKKDNTIKIENDFFWNTLEHAKTVSDEDVQDLIAKIIAGEYNNPGSFSMRTLQIIRNLGKDDIFMFQNICSLCINETDIPYSVFLRPKPIKNLLESMDLDYSSLQHLQSLGLFFSNILYSKQEFINCFNIYYQNRTLTFMNTYQDFKEIKPIVVPEYYQLTSSGHQIASLLNLKFHQHYFQWLKSDYQIDNFTLAETS